MRDEDTILRLAKDEDNKEESYPLIEGTDDSAQMRQPKRLLSQRSPVWMLTTFVLAFLLLANMSRNYVQERRDIPHRYGYETGFDTDWTLTRDVVQLKKVKFYGGIFFDENKDRYVSTNPDEATYVGPPTQEIDDAWLAISQNESIAVTAEEAKEVSDQSDFDKYRGHYTVGLSVLHSLHCLNALRISLDIDHYRAKGYPEEWWARFHLDHCINHLRQDIQCHSDLTPFPLVPASRDPANKGWITPNFDRTHTCRDFAAIRQWSIEKHASGLRKAKANPHGEVSQD